MCQLLSQVMQVVAWVGSTVLLKIMLSNVLGASDDVSVMIGHDKKKKNNTIESRPADKYFFFRPGSHQCSDQV